MILASPGEVLLRYSSSLSERLRKALLLPVLPCGIYFLFLFSTGAQVLWVCVSILGGLPIQPERMLLPIRENETARTSANLLRIELAATVDAGEPFVRKTYLL